MRGQRGFIGARRAILAGLALALAAAGARAQSVPELPQPSPKARVEQRVGLTDFAVAYSSPGVKGRPIWGELVPYDELWRSGANAATTLQSSHDFTFGGVRVPAGTYALYTIPGKDEWAVILNSNATASGTRGYDEKKNVARVSVKPAAAPFRERLTYLFADTTDDGSRLDLEWEKRRISVPITVDTRAAATGNIDTALAEAWRPHFNSARYLLDSGGDLDTALDYADTSIAIKPTWSNNWVKAQILAKQGKRSDAVAAAEQAQQLGRDDPVFKEFFQTQVANAIAEWKRPS
jgi:Protein of unknown function (DUF2911)